MTREQIKQNLDDAAALWAARMDREAFDRAVKRRKDERTDRSIKALAVRGSVLFLLSLFVLLYLGATTR